jgi:hypothetical protein
MMVLTATLEVRISLRWQTRLGFSQPYPRDGLTEVSPSRSAIKRKIIDTKKHALRGVLLASSEYRVRILALDFAGALIEYC